jgi:hypothetical protein
MAGIDASWILITLALGYRGSGRYTSRQQKNGI